MSLAVICKTIGCSHEVQQDADFCNRCMKEQELPGSSSPLDVPDFRHIRHMDSDRVNQLFGIKHPSVQQAVHLLLQLGKASAETQDELVDNAIAKLERWKSMNKEDQEATAFQAGL